MALLTLATGCSKSNGPYLMPEQIAPEKGAPSFSYQKSDSLQENLFGFYLSWRGTPYRLGGLSQSGIDCSGFVLLAYRDIFGLKLPRTTREQSHYGKRVKKSELRTGDLLFFKTGRFQNHVGLYWQEGTFIHASTSKGVMASSLNNPYWTKNFTKATRPHQFGPQVASAHP